MGKTLIVEHKLGKYDFFEFPLDSYVYEVVDDTKYVQVQLVPHGTTWTYEDPFGDLKVGDLVDVPFGFANKLTLARVVALGKGNYSGPYKAVHARYQKDEA